jgi:glycosyltransferase involved in cell wall biosynthesis
MKRLRLTWVATHPSQYLAPFLRHLTNACPELDVTAVYASIPTAAQHGREFATEVDWGVPLLDGYRYVVMRSPRPGDVFTYDRLHGIDVSGVTQVLRDTRPDLVLVPGWHSIFLLRAIAGALRLGVPLMYRGDSHLHSSGAGIRRAVAHQRARWLLKAFTSGLAVGRLARAYLLALGLPHDRVFDVPHCVDNDFFDRGARAARASGRAAARADFGIPSDSFTALFVGKLAAHKKVDDLITAMARVAGAPTLHIVGSGPEEQRYREAAQRAGLHAVFSGFLNQQQVVKAYAAADCLVLPSRETWGMVCNEALAGGLPIIASDRVGSAPDLVDRGQTGEVFGYGDVGDLTAALVRTQRLVEREPNLVADRCRTKAEAHGFAVVGAALAEACQQTLAAIGRVASTRLIVPMQKSVLVAGNEKSLFEVFELVRERGGVTHCLVNAWDSARIRDGAEKVGATWSYSRHWYPIRRRSRNPLRWMQMAWEVTKCSGELWHAARRRRATHVLFPDFVSLLLHWPAMQLLRLTGTRVALRVANPPEDARFYQFLWRVLVLPSVDLLVANSRFTSGCVAAVSGPQTKLRWTYQPAPDVPISRVTRDPAKVVFVGQILPEKGISVLFDAVETLLARGVDVRLDVVGELNSWMPPQLEAFRPTLLDRAGRPPLAGAVRMCGWLEDVTTLLAGAAVHCAPSMPRQREAMGRVIIEAKATATPSVVFPTGALPEMVHHGVDGWVCRDTSSEALAEGLEWYLHHPDRVHAHGAAARDDVQRFSRAGWVAVWSDVLALEEDARRRNRRPAYS